MDLTIAIVWLVVSILATGVCVITWVVISSTASRKNGFHVFLSSVLTSRVILSLGVTSLDAIYAFLDADWSVLACHALYWLWTVTWLSDITAVCGATCWALVKLRRLRSALRLGSTIAVSGLWLLTTTSAGLLTYFNRRIKDEVALGESGCDVLPKLTEHALSIAIFSVQVVAVLFALTLLCPYMVTLGHVVRDACKMADGHTGKGRPATNGVPEVIISQETVQNESPIQPVRVPRRECFYAPLRLDGAVIRCLYDWRRCLSLIVILSILLNVLPHLVMLGANIFLQQAIPGGTTILLSCHLAHSLMLPVLLLFLSREYRKACLKLFRRKGTQVTGQTQTGNLEPAAPQPATNAGDAPSMRLAHQPPASSDSGVINVCYQEIEGTDPPKAERDGGKSDKSSRGTLEVASSVFRSESRLSRLEWKEQMMKSSKLPVATVPLKGKAGKPMDPRSSPSSASSSSGAEMNKGSAKERKDVRRASAETESDMASGRFNYSDIDRVLASDSPPSTTIKVDSAERRLGASENGPLKSRFSNRRSSFPASDSSAAESHDIVSSHVMGQKMKTVGRRRRGVKVVHSPRLRRKNGDDTRTQEIYATVSRALGLDLGGNSRRFRHANKMNRRNTPDESDNRAEVVYSPTNPFFSAVQEVDDDSQSERSVEAEIVAITIRGRGSLKRKLRNKGLLPGGTYISAGNDLIVKERDPDRVGSTLPAGDWLATAQRQSTNPFIDDLRSSTKETQRQTRNTDVGASYTRDWLEGQLSSTQSYPALPPRSPNPFLSSQDDNVSVDDDIYRRKSASNPFLQFVGEDDMVTGDADDRHTGDTADSDGVTHSAPASPRINRKRRLSRPRLMRPAVLAVSAIENGTGRDRKGTYVTDYL